jgi:hypothetical protein
MEDTVTVALKDRPVFGFVLGIFAPFAVLAADRIRRKKLIFQFFKLLARENH